MIHTSKGELAEAFVENLLLQRGYAVQNLNQSRRNMPIVDLEVEGIGQPFQVSVKSCWAATRQLRLGTPNSLAQLPDAAFVMALLPPSKGMVLDLNSDATREARAFILWIIPGKLVREEALAAHYHYANHHPGSTRHSVMVKDKIDRNETTRSGTLFQRWSQTYDSAWHLLPAPFA